MSNRHLAPIKLSACTNQWTRRPDADLERRAERFRLIIRDRSLDRLYIDASTFRHYGGLIREMQERGIEDARRHAVWFEAFRCVA